MLKEWQDPVRSLIGGLPFARNEPHLIHLILVGFHTEFASPVAIQ
jgi:hypothetical protein